MSKSDDPASAGSSPGGAGGLMSNRGKEDARIMKKRRRYTPEQLECLREGYLVMNIECLTIAFNAEFGTGKTESQIKSALQNHGIRCGRSHKERLVLNRLRRFTPEQADFITKNYAGRSVADLTDLFNERFDDHKTKQQIKTFVHNRGIVSGRTGFFEKGNVPHNKGRKGWQAGGNSSKTRFKKGIRPHTWVPVGSERFSKEGIRQRKVTDTGPSRRDWKSVHSLLWEEHYGPVPKGHIVVFRNGDRADIRIDNLELITREENMRRNTIHNLPEELADVCRLRGMLNRRIRERSETNEKQDRGSERSPVRHHRKAAR